MLTELLIQELQRTLARAKEYAAHPGDPGGSATHAGLVRATLDLSGVLVQWRHAPRWNHEKAGNPK